MSSTAKHKAVEDAVVAWRLRWRGAVDGTDAQRLPFSDAPELCSAEIRGAIGEPPYLTMLTGAPVREFVDSYVGVPGFDTPWRISGERVRARLVAAIQNGGVEL